MYERYLVTGATGNLGRHVVSALRAGGNAVRALILPGDAGAGNLPAGVEIAAGDVSRKPSLAGFFSGDLRRACLIHCAGKITIASRRPADLFPINVEGTRNVMELCRERNVARAVCVGSVHAISERPGVMDEEDLLTSGRVRGGYAKSKLAAVGIALAAAKDGLNVSVALPSGILSPTGGGRDNISAAVLDYCRGNLPVAVSGGYDFVDVRDVTDGILACAREGRAGETYLLTGRYASLREILEHVRRRVGGRPVTYLPLWIVKALSPFFEAASLLRGKPLFLTPYSAYVMGSNAAFSHEKATRELHYRPRPLEDTLDDMLREFRNAGLSA